MHHYYEADGMTQKDDADYPRYENYPAIDVNRVNKIPIDYKGIMGVPMTFLEYYDPEELDMEKKISIIRLELNRLENHF